MSVKFRLGKIFPKSLVPGKKGDHPTINRHVFMNFKVQKYEFSMSGPLFVYPLIKCYALFIKKSQKPLSDKSYLPKSNAQAKIDH